MEMKEIMDQKVFAVLGNTLDPEKYASIIKNAMLEKGYTVYAVGKELASLNDIPEDIDVIDLCIHPVKGLALLKENKKPFRCIVIQPGAENPELIDYLEANHLPYLRGCLLKGLEAYKA